MRVAPPPSAEGTIATGAVAPQGLRPPACLHISARRHYALPSHCIVTRRIHSAGRGTVSVSVSVSELRGVGDTTERVPPERAGCAPPGRLEGRAPSRPFRAQSRGERVSISVSELRGGAGPGQAGSSRRRVPAAARRGKRVRSLYNSV